MNARNVEVQRALKRGDTVELIRLMLQVRETIRLHPAYLGSALAAMNQGFCRIISIDLTQPVILERVSQ